MGPQRGTVAPEGLVEPLGVWGRLVNRALTIVNGWALGHDPTIITILAEFLDLVPERPLREDLEDED